MKISDNDDGFCIEPTNWNRGRAYYALANI